MLKHVDPAIGVRATGVRVTWGGAVAEVVADVVVDCEGMSCPLPVVKTAQAIKNLQAGQLLELLATDPGVEPDMNAWSSRTGNPIEQVRREGDVFHVLIRKGA